MLPRPMAEPTVARTNPTPPDQNSLRGSIALAISAEKPLGRSPNMLGSMVYHVETGQGGGARRCFDYGHGDQGHLAAASELPPMLTGKRTDGGIAMHGLRRAKLKSSAVLLAYALAGASA